jgi:hypothetical protein
MSLIMVCPHTFETPENQQRVKRHGLHFGGRSTQVGNDVLVVHGGDIDGGYKARKYQLIEPQEEPTDVCVSSSSSATTLPAEVSLGIIREALSGFETAKKLQILHELLSETGNSDSGISTQEQLQPLLRAPTTTTDGNTEHARGGGGGTPDPV